MRTVESYERRGPIPEDLAEKLEALGIEIPRVKVTKHVRTANGGRPRAEDQDGA